MLVSETMRTRSTSDVPIDLLREFRDDLGSEFNLEVEESQIVLLSVEPPSWIQLLAESNWWLNGLAAASALYVAELVKEAAKETWKNRAKAVGVVVGAANKVREFAEKIVRLKQKLPERTGIVVALPLLNDYFGARLTLFTGDPDSLAIQIALFVSHVPALVELMHAENIESSGTATGLFLELLGNGDLKVSWYGRKSLELQSRVIPLRSQL